MAVTDRLLVVLRALHVTFGVYWAGGRFLTVAYPAFMLDARDRADVTPGRLIRYKRMTTSIGVSGVLTILTGSALYWLVSGGDPAWIGSTYGGVITVGAVAGVTAWLVGATISYYSQRRARSFQEATRGAELTDDQSARLHRLVGRLVRGERVNAALLLVSVLAMATAAYL